MNALATLTAGSATPSATGARVERQPSKILPALFQQLNPDRPLNVLDVGPAMSETVTFFSRVPCRLHFFDLYNEPLVSEHQKEHSDWETKVKFGKLLDFQTGHRIDLCLFWDFLNYLDAPALRAFSAALRPWLHVESLAHGFAVRTEDTWLPEQQYAIHSADTISVRPALGRPKTNYPHTQRALNDLMPGFRVNRGTLLADGRVELLMRPD